MYAPKGFFTKLIEGALCFVAAALLVRFGILMIKSVIVWILIIAGIIFIVWAFIKLRRHHKDTHGF